MSKVPMRGLLRSMRCPRKQRLPHWSPQVGLESKSSRACCVPLQRNKTWRGGRETSLHGRFRAFGSARRVLRYCFVRTRSWVRERNS